ncbi:contractile injection system tape measure protein [Chitinophaga alhagiae]|uniref:contractile injection system tape measure protein n=1 Tax=Chitinophaga alhagiae TaxID=2203219 RepID=UPI000E5A69F2|nr:contractile injection system tape measure protein [Chitinophaga alhagiae]
MEVRNSVLSEQEQPGGLYPEAEPEPQWGLCSVSEIYQYAWFFFMQYGLIPWWMQQETPDSLEENIIAAVQRQPPLCRAKWLQARAGNRLCIPRWVLQCSSSLQQAVLHAVLGETAGNAAAAAESSLRQRFSPLPVAQHSLRCLYWDALFSTMMAGEKPLCLKEKIREKWTGWMKTAISISGSKILDNIAFPDNLDAQAMPVAGESAGNPAAPDLGLDEPLLVKQAGLVMLHAQLARLLTDMQWLRPGGAGILPELHSRAVHLLAFMADGEEQAPEYNMALHKLLCGIPLNEPVEKNVWLTEQEKQAAVAGVDALAAAYGLGRQGFRNLLLRRNGKLRFAGGEWVLTVLPQTGAEEQLSGPALPDATPQPLQLPWMQHLVTVQWTT